MPVFRKPTVANCWSMTHYIALAVRVLHKSFASITRSSGYCRTQLPCPAYLLSALSLIVVSWLSGALISVAHAQDGSDVRHPPGGYSIYIVPHSHMDLEWFWTYEQAQTFSIRILRQALRMLKDDPKFAFTQDQLRALKPFWDSLSSDERTFLRRMISERRFEVATGMWVQPDVNEPSFESLTRQFLLAKPWMEKTLGAEIRTAWNIDTFGQTIQMPQLYRQAGLRYSFFSRDFPPQVKDSAKNLFYWRSPDGSQVLAHLGSYYLGLGLHPKFPQANRLEFLQDLIRRNPEGNDKIMIPWGADATLPTETSQQLEKWARQAASAIGIPIKNVLVSTPSRYFEDVERSGIVIPTYTYDFNPPLLAQDLRGIWGQRPAQKILGRYAEDMLVTSEKLSSIMGLYGLRYPDRDLAWAWQRVLDNHSHDTMAGSHTDAVAQIAITRYGGAIEAARQVQADALFHLSRAIDTSRSGNLTFVVFNGLSFSRTEVVRYEVTFAQEANMTFMKDNSLQVYNFRLLDPAGNDVPFRVAALSRSNAIASELAGASLRDEGPLTMAIIEFVATKVPPLGYRVYRIEPTEGTIQIKEWQSIGREISNRFFTLRIDPTTGSISKLVDRRSGREFLASSRYSGNELILGEEDRPSMEGGIHFTGSEVRGSKFRPDSVEVRTDKIGTTVRIVGPFLKGHRVQEIKLYEEVPRIDFRTKLKGFPGHDGMLTVVFPIGPNTRSQYETHNAVVERLDGIYAAHSWVDLANSGSGMAILNKGTGGHQIENDVARLILLRSITDYEGYNAADASEDGDHEFEYSLYPHSGDWTEGGVVEQAHSFNSPLRTIPSDAHEGTLPLERSFLQISTGNFEVTALKKAEEGTELILRGHEIKGRTGRVRLKIGFPVLQAWLADLLERPGKEVAIQQASLEFDCEPFEFVTLRLKVNAE